MLCTCVASKNPNIPIEIGKMYADIPTEDCHEFMEEIMPSGNAGERSKIMETLFLKYTVTHTVMRFNFTYN